MKALCFTPAACFFGPLFQSHTSRDCTLVDLLMHCRDVSDEQASLQVCAADCQRLAVSTAILNAAGAAFVCLLTGDQQLLGRHWQAESSKTHQPLWSCANHRCRTQDPPPYHLLFIHQTGMKTLEVTVETNANYIGLVSRSLDKEPTCFRCSALPLTEMHLWPSKLHFHADLPEMRFDFLYTCR